MASIQHVMRDLRAVDCDVLTIGQYLQPTRHHLSVQHLVPPEVFRELHDDALVLGFRYCESGPLVRRSCHAERQGR